MAIFSHSSNRHQHTDYHPVGAPSGHWVQNVAVADADRSHGWHPDPVEGAGTFRYWDGHRWTATMKEAPGRQSVRYSLDGWRKVWYSKIVRFPLLFYPLSWFNSSVPVTRRHLDRLLQPREVREARARHNRPTH